MTEQKKPHHNTPKIVEFTEQFNLEGGNQMCTAAACMVCFIASDPTPISKESEYQTHFTEDIGNDQLNYIMNISVEVYKAIQKHYQNTGKTRSPPTFDTREIVEFLKSFPNKTVKWKFETDVETKEIA
eukprot:3939584-Rhodomonas_salina.1